MIHRTKIRVGLCILLICMNVAFSWGNSLLPGEASAALSGQVRQLQSVILPKSIAGSINDAKGHNFLRKIAHLMEFGCLGGFLCWLGWMMCSKFGGRLLLPWLGGVLAGGVDEMIQCFVPGRGPSIKDVGIDAIGTAIGVVLLSMGFWIQTRKSIYNLEVNKK